MSWHYGNYTIYCIFIIYYMNWKYYCVSFANIYHQTFYCCFTRPASLCLNAPSLVIYNGIFVIWVIIWPHRLLNDSCISYLTDLLAHHLTLAPSSDTSTSNSTFSPTTVWTSSSGLVMVTGGSADKTQSFESNYKTESLTNCIYGK